MKVVLINESLNSKDYFTAMNQSTTGSSVDEKWIRTDFIVFMSPSSAYSWSYFKKNFYKYVSTKGFKAI